MLAPTLKKGLPNPKNGSGTKLASRGDPRAAPLNCAYSGPDVSPSASLSARAPRRSREELRYLRTVALIFALDSEVATLPTFNGSPLKIAQGDLHIRVQRLLALVSARAPEQLNLKRTDAATCSRRVRDGLGRELALELGEAPHPKHPRHYAFCNLLRIWAREVESDRSAQRTSDSQSASATRPAWVARYEAACESLAVGERVREERTQSMTFHSPRDSFRGHG